MLFLQWYDLTPFTYRHTSEKFSSLKVSIFLKPHSRHSSILMNKKNYDNIKNRPNLVSSLCSFNEWFLSNPRFTCDTLGYVVQCCYFFRGHCPAFTVGYESYICRICYILLKLYMAEYVKWEDTSLAYATF